MSATNTTTNYSLPIFIETDKPAWLVDFNGAMRAIDAQMKTNADAIATKSPILTFNDTAEIDFTKSGDIITANLASGVSDKVGRALVTPISAPASEQLVAINTSGAQAAMEIGSGLFNNNGTLEAADLNFTVQGSSNTYTEQSQNSSWSGALNYALNEDRTIGKIYGVVDVTGSATGFVSAKTGIIVDAPSASYNIGSAGISYQANQGISNATLVIDTDGSVTVRVYRASSTGGTRIVLLPMIYIFTNFGDE